MTLVHGLGRLAPFALAVMLCASPARAWVDARVTGDETRVEVDRAGFATVEEGVTLQVTGGPLKTLEVPGLPREATPLPEATAIPASADGPVTAPLPVVATPRPEGGARLVFDAPRGLPRGRWLVRLRWRMDLAAAGAIERDGAQLRVRWTGPGWPDGVDGARCTFAVPAAPVAPRAVLDGTEPLAPEGGSAAPLRRGADRDEVDIVRAHVARSESPVWTVRLDARALSEVRDPRLRAPAPPPPLPVEPAPARALRLGLLAALAVAFSSLLARKSHEVALAAAAARARARPWLPIGRALRALVAGPLFAGGVALQLAHPDASLGSALVALAALLGLYRTPVAAPRLRGPGRWLPLADRDAFAAPPPSGAWLDPGSRRGRVALAALVLGAAAAAAILASRLSPWHGGLAALDAVPLLALFATGRCADMPADPARAPAAAAAWLARRLRARKGVRAVPWGRMPAGARTPDELRLLVGPVVPRRGMLSLEVGWTWVRGTGGWLGLPELLVRVVDASPCHDAVSQAIPGLRWVRGRTPDERVASLTPRLPGRRALLALVARVVEIARDPEPAAAAIAPAARQPSTSAASSRGSAERTANAGTAASPLHAT